MMNFDDTIAAIATAPGTGAIAVVRMSGQNSFLFAKKIFRHKDHEPGKGDTHFKSHRAIFGRIVNPDTSEQIDEVVLTAFQAPHTYTGEDIVEISCHGGKVVTAELLGV